LQKSNGIPEHVEALISDFDALFEHNSRPAGTRLYRACPRFTVAQLITAGTMVYPAFMSTSNSTMSASIFYGHIPAADHPVYLHLILEDEMQTVDAQSRIYKGIGEGEFVLPRGIRLTLKKILECGAYEILVSNV
jgi:hypothetical protein